MPTSSTTSTSPSLGASFIFGAQQPRVYRRVLELKRGMTILRVHNEECGLVLAVVDNVRLCRRVIGESSDGETDSLRTALHHVACFMSLLTYACGRYVNVGYGVLIIVVAVITQSESIQVLVVMVVPMREVAVMALRYLICDAQLLAWITIITVIVLIVALPIVCPLVRKGPYFFFFLPTVLFVLSRFLLESKSCVELARIRNIQKRRFNELITSLTLGTFMQQENAISIIPVFFSFRIFVTIIRIL
mmetsp:Transcript_35231/g.49070  ORF Transcript_35231/g.49070 Transcript_35231/m.49070 type:complete len:247 (+) Transcript_35231:572-1312(+)